MRIRGRIVLIAAGSTALALGAGVPAVPASAAGAGTPGWRQVREFDDCQGGDGIWVTANGPRNAWGSGFCGPVLAHWNGQSWREVLLPSRFSTARADPAIASLSGSYVWAFAGLGGRSHALLRDNGRWRAFALAAGSFLTSAAVFSRTSAWAFGTADAAAYAVRFNGTTWRRVKIPVVPQATAEPGPGDIWAAGPPATAAGKLPGILALAHWSGKWATHRFPDLHLPSGQSLTSPSVVADGSGGAWITATITGRAGGGVLLHWTGTTWNQAQIPFPTLTVGALARDGHGGLWIASVLNAPSFPISMLHRTRAGTWTSTVLSIDCLDHLDSIRQIRGTAGSLWAGGILDANNDTFPVILKYGP